jgi:hypothetical protein
MMHDETVVKDFDLLDDSIFNDYLDYLLPISTSDSTVSVLPFIATNGFLRSFNSSLEVMIYGKKLDDENEWTGEWTTN